MKNTHRYEFLLTLRSKNPDEVKTAIDKLTADVESDGAAVEQVQNMDRKNFSYTAGDLSSGTFVNFIVVATPEVVDKLRARFKLDAEVYRQHCQKLAPKKVAPKAAA